MEHRATEYGDGQTATARGWPAIFIWQTAGGIPDLFLRDGRGGRSRTAATHRDSAVFYHLPPLPATAYIPSPFCRLGLTAAPRSRRQGTTSRRFRLSDIGAEDWGRGVDACAVCEHSLAGPPHLSLALSPYSYSLLPGKKRRTYQGFLKHSLLGVRGGYGGRFTAGGQASVPTSLRLCHCRPRE